MIKVKKFKFVIYKLLFKNCLTYTVYIYVYIYVYMHIHTLHTDVNMYTHIHTLHAWPFGSHEKLHEIAIRGALKKTGFL